MILCLRACLLGLLWWLCHPPPGSTGWLCSSSLQGSVPMTLLSWDSLSKALSDWGPEPQALQKPYSLKFRWRQPHRHGSPGQSPCYSSLQGPRLQRPTLRHSAGTSWPTELDRRPHSLKAFCTLC